MPIEKPRKDKYYQEVDKDRAEGFVVAQNTNVKSQKDLPEEQQEIPPLCSDSSDGEGPRPKPAGRRKVTEESVDDSASGGSDSDDNEQGTCPIKPTAECSHASGSEDCAVERELLPGDRQYLCRQIETGDRTFQANIAILGAELWTNK